MTSSAVTFERVLNLLAHKTRERIIPVIVINKYSYFTLNILILKSQTSKTEQNMSSATATAGADDSAWKTEHPYKKPTGDDEDFKVEWEASCHCGNVKYQLNREKPLASKYCHCHQCQRMHAVSKQTDMTSSPTPSSKVAHTNPIPSHNKKRPPSSGPP